MQRFQRYILGMVITTILFSCKMEQTNQFNVRQEAILTLVNEARSTACTCGSRTMSPAPPLRWNDQLAKAAHTHSQAMSEKGFFSHRGRNGSKPGERVTQAGYTWSTCGENIAKGQLSEQEVVDGWLNSPNHCKNIMNPDFTEVGIARSGDYWVQVFAAPH